MNEMEFNVQHQERLVDVFSRCPVKYRKVEAFDSFDWNVAVENENVDDFTDWCEDNAVTCEMV